jgi:AraC-like DNA-binding protein
MRLLYTEYQPSPELRPFVHSYGSFTSLSPDAAAARRLPGNGACEYVFAPGDPMIDRVFGCVQMSLNFNLGDPFAFSRADEELPVTEPAHVFGAVTRPGRMRLPDRVEFFGVIFRPGCAQPFLGVPAGELTDQVLGLEHLWGTQGRALAERLSEARTTLDRARLVEAELRHRLAAAPRVDRTVPAIAEHVLRHPGTWSVERLSAVCGFTRQHLARKFRDGLGVSPKLFCRLVRFQNTFTRVSVCPPDNWAAAALELGYYDQAHLIAEFKEFTGFTPTGFAALR